jgi:hypothetical protein
MELERRHKVADIENVLLSQTNVAPILVKDVAKVTVSHVSRLGKADRAGAAGAPRWRGGRALSAELGALWQKRSLETISCLSIPGPIASSRFPEEAIRPTWLQKHRRPAFK